MGIDFTDERLIESKAIFAMSLTIHISPFLASALQWKALHSSKDMQISTLRQAESEAIDAVEIVATHYSEISLCTARMCVLLGQIKSKMDMYVFYSRKSG